MVQPSSCIATKKVVGNVIYGMPSEHRLLLYQIIGLGKLEYVPHFLELSIDARDTPNDGKTSFDVIILVLYPVSRFTDLMNHSL